MKKIFLASVSLLMTPYAFAQNIGIRDVLTLPVTIESATNVSYLETPIRNIYNNLSNSFPKQGVLSELSGQFILSFFSYSGEFCKLMINRDMKKPINQRWILFSIDFNIPPQNWTQNSVDKLFDNYSQMFWQRNLTDEERFILNRGYQDILADMPPNISSNEILLTALCSVYFTSPGFLFVGGY